MWWLWSENQQGQSKFRIVDEGGGEILKYFRMAFKSEKPHFEFSKRGTRNHLHLFIWRPTQSRSLSQIKFTLKVKLQQQPKIWGIDQEALEVISSKTLIPVVWSKYQFIL